MSDRLAELSRALGFEAPPEEILATLREVYAAVDAEIAAGCARLELPCKAGCDACCHEAVFLSAPEFLAVAAEVLRWPAAERSALLDRMREIADTYEDELELLEILEPGPERDEVAARVKFTCPMLAEGRCRVYAARELNARTFGLSVDEVRGQPYGCGLTQEALRVLDPERVARLAGARAARRLLAERLPNTATVHVFPWWFVRHRRAFTAATPP